MSTTHPHYTSTDKCVKSVSMIRLQLFEYKSTVTSKVHAVVPVCKSMSTYVKSDGQLWPPFKSSCLNFSILGGGNVCLIFDIFCSQKPYRYIFGRFYIHIGLELQMHN